MSTCLAALFGAACREAPPTAKEATAHPTLSQVLPPMTAGQLRVTVLEVEYGPGGSSAPHRHPCAVIGYVIDGGFHSQTEGGHDTVYRAGESFYEAPNAVHQISANASDRKRVRFTATFLCDTEAPLTVPVPGT